MDFVTSDENTNDDSEWEIGSEDEDQFMEDMSVNQHTYRQG